MTRATRNVSKMNTMTICGRTWTICWFDDIDEPEPDIRDAMAAMANVMSCTYVAATWRDNVVGWYLNGMERADVNWRNNIPADPRMGSFENVKALASREWSAEVRRKVAALPKPGVRVACQNEED
jgi:hypothetical protein